MQRFETRLSEHVGSTVLPLKLFCSEAECRPEFHLTTKHQFGGGGGLCVTLCGNSWLWGQLYFWAGPKIALHYFGASRWWGTRGGGL